MSGGRHVFFTFCKKKNTFTKITRFSKVHCAQTVRDPTGPSSRTQISGSRGRHVGISGTRTFLAAGHRFGLARPLAASHSLRQVGIPALLLRNAAVEHATIRGVACVMQRVTADCTMKERQVLSAVRPP
jgi:hypothetical protein